MKITPQQFLDKLAASPRDAAEFDACAPAGMSRRDHVVRTLNLVENTIAYNKAAKEKLIAARARIAALERVRASLPAPRAGVTRTPTAVSPPKNMTSDTPTLDQFESLTGPKASHYYATNRKAITAEFASRQRDDRQLEAEMHAARASAKQAAQVKKYNR